MTFSELESFVKSFCKEQEGLNFRREVLILHSSRGVETVYPAMQISFPSLQVGSGAAYVTLAYTKRGSVGLYRGSTRVLPKLTFGKPAQLLPYLQRLVRDWGKASEPVPAPAPVVYVADEPSGPAPAPVVEPAPASPAAEPTPAPVMEKKPAKRLTPREALKKKASGGNPRKKVRKKAAVADKKKAASTDQPKKRVGRRKLPATLSKLVKSYAKKNGLSSADGDNFGVSLSPKGTTDVFAEVSVGDDVSVKNSAGDIISTDSRDFNDEWLAEALSWARGA